MTVLSARGFRSAGIAAGIKASGKRDLAVVVNDGPMFNGAGVFTRNRVQAAPVLWSRSALANGVLHGVVLNSGGANACTGPEGFDDAQRMAEVTAQHLGSSMQTTGVHDSSTNDSSTKAASTNRIFMDDVAVCSTGLIGRRLPLGVIVDGIPKAVQALSTSGSAGIDAAIAIMTTDAVPKTSSVSGDGFTIGAMAKGAAMLAPALATMLVVLTTDAEISSPELQKALKKACSRTFDRLDSDGCMSTNDTVLLMASGASGVAPSTETFAEALEQICADLSRQLISDGEGATKDIAIDVVRAYSEADALEVARSAARSNLLKCAIHGQDANWGRVLAAVGTTSAAFDPGNIAVAMNGIWVCRNGAIGDDCSKVDLSGREVRIIIDLGAGDQTATVLTNDLSSAYVYENSAYPS